jgi:hypothetical protein
VASWDRQSARALDSLRRAAVERQLRDVVGPFSPYWREAVRAARARGLRGLEALAEVPPRGERDVCPDGDPAGAAALVVQPGERGYALHAPGPRLRRALRARVRSRDDYRRVVETDTRPTTYVLGGLAVPMTFASTRGDLDLVARAGARLWQVLGLGPADVLVSALPARPTAENRALELAALASGAPALAGGEGPRDVAGALRLLPATVLAVRPSAAPGLLAALRESGLPGSLRTLLLVGAPTPEERRAAAAGVAAAAGAGVDVLAAHAPSGARVLWGECRESALADRAAEAGFHAYPDLDHVESADPETGERLPSGSPGGELLLTQLGFAGSALVRWRTGDLVAGVTDESCPDCGRRVPRVTGVAPGALVPRLALREGERRVDLRAVAGALAADRLHHWRVEVRRGARDGLDQVLVHVDSPGDAVDTAVAVARAVRRAAGLLPTQVVVAPLERARGGAPARRLPSTGGLP